MSTLLPPPRCCPICSIEQVQFPVVEQHTEVLQARAWSYTVYQCVLCQSEFAWPRQAAPSEWYAENGEYYGWRWEFDQFINDISALTVSSGQTQSVKILEVGCGEGLLLEAARAYGEVWGLEFNRHAAEIGRAKGLNITAAGLHDFLDAHPAIKFRIIGCFQVLEHVEHPREFLARMREAMDPEGWLFVSVPNPDRYMLRLEREQWDLPPHHLTRFSKNGLRKLFDQSGFRMMKMISRPMGASDTEAIFRAVYHRVTWSRRLRHALKLPIRIACYPLAGWMRRTFEGQDLYVAARKS